MKQIISTILPLLISFGFLKSYPQSININTFIHSGGGVQVVDKTIFKEDDYLKVNVKYPQVFNETNKGGELNNKIEKWTLDWLDDIELLVKNTYGDNFPKPQQKYEAISNYDIKTNSNILSLTMTYYQYTGGAHGLTTVIPYNYNIKTGEILSLSDIFKSGYDYKTVINNEIAKQISEEKEKYFQGSDGFNGIKDNQNFYIQDDSIVILFGLYEIAPYVSGIIEFSIPMKLVDNGIDYGKIN